MSLPPVVRRAEVSLAEKFLFGPGDTLQKATWRIQPPEKTAYTITVISWELWAQEEADLCDLLWNGKLHWNFGPIRLEVASLSYFQGSMAQLAEALTLAEQLTLADKIEEQEYRSRKRLGSWTICRGLFQYLQTPILIPSNAGGDLEVGVYPNFKAREAVRIGLHVHATSQSTSPIVIG